MSAQTLSRKVETNKGTQEAYPSLHFQIKSTPPSCQTTVDNFMSSVIRSSAAEPIPFVVRNASRLSRRFRIDSPPPPPLLRE